MVRLAYVAVEAEEISLGARGTSPGVLVVALAEALPVSLP